MTAHAAKDGINAGQDYSAQCADPESRFRRAEGIGEQGSKNDRAGIDGHADFGEDIRGERDE